MKERENGGSGYGYGYGYGSGSYQSQNYGGASGSQNVQMQAVYNYLNSRHYREALNVLSSLPNRTAEWYYASAVANAGIGNNIMARDHAGQAVNMEPNNLMYRQLLNQLEWNGQRYQNNPQSPFNGKYGNNMDSCSTGNMSCDLWILDSLCECMGGDLCSCM